MSTITGTINKLDYDSLNREIKRTMKRSARDVVQLGFMLRRMMEEHLWTAMYEDFDSYLAEELHMDYTAATRFIRINKKYSWQGHSMEVAEEYEDYSQSLLIEMLNMPPELEAKVTPDMTVSQVREIKRQAKKKEKAAESPVPEKKEVIIDGEYREIKEVEKVATSQPLSAYGLPKTEYPESSVLATKGCGHNHTCFSCAEDCGIRQEERYCVEAPLGNPFSCMTMNVVENLKEEMGERCQFINQESAYHRQGDNSPVPCCKKCAAQDCGYRCRRAVGTYSEEVEKEEFSSELEEAVIEDDIAATRYILEEQKKLLDDYLEVGGLPEMTVFKQKIIVAALASMVAELEMQIPIPEPEEPEQPELPVLKNNDQRKEWLGNYKEWGLWYRDEHIDVNYYKYDFQDGSRLVVAEYPQRFAYWNSESRDEHHYHLLEKNKKGYKNVYDEKYRQSTDSETYLIDFLKNIQKKGQ